MEITVGDQCQQKHIRRSQTRRYNNPNVKYTESGGRVTEGDDDTDIRNEERLEKRFSVPD